MTLINLTEKDHETLGYLSLTRAKDYFNLDFYYASSLAAVEKGFAICPPRKRESFMFNRANAAIVLVRDVQIKRLHPDYVDEEDSTFTAELDECCRFPCFVVKDETSIRVATWMVGNSRNYFEDMENFGMNRETFVRVPKIYFKYIHNYSPDDSRGWLIIKHISNDEILSRDRKRESLTDRFNLLIGKVKDIDLGGIVPQPALA